MGFPLSNLVFSLSNCGLWTIFWYPPKSDVNPPYRLALSNSNNGPFIRIYWRAELKAATIQGYLVCTYLNGYLVDVVNPPPPAPSQNRMYRMAGKVSVACFKRCYNRTWGVGPRALKILTSLSANKDLIDVHCLDGT
jgi:hypothetical protein